jgi:hypothetical protein
MKLYLAVIVRLDRTIQYSRALVMESKSCGVLDTPLSRSMTAYCGAAQCVAVASRSHHRGSSHRRIKISSAERHKSQDFLIPA